MNVTLVPAQKVLSASFDVKLTVGRALIVMAGEELLVKTGFEEVTLIK